MQVAIPQVESLPKQMCYKCGKVGPHMKPPGTVGYAAPACVNCNPAFLDALDTPVFPYTEFTPQQAFALARLRRHWRRKRKEKDNH